MINLVGMGRRLAQLASGVLVTTMLVACGGGGGNAGDPVLGGNPGTTPSTLADLSIVTDRSSVTNAGTETVNVTVTALGAGNAALTGVAVPVTLEVDNGAIITAGSKTTSTSNGQVTAVVALTDRTNRTVKITAKSGNFTKTATFDVVDSVTGTKVADMSLVLDRAQIFNDNSQQALLTVTTLDALRNASGGAPVTLQVMDPSNTAFLTGATPTTDAATGQLTARLSVGTSKTNRTLTIKATSGTVQRTVSIDVVESVVTVPVAADMSIALSRTSITNTGTDPVEVTVTAVDASRNAVAGLPVRFAVDNNAVVTVVNATTDANGQAKANVRIGADRTNRTVTVTATVGTLSRTAAFKVVGSKLTATLLPAALTTGSTGKVEYTLTDSGSNPMADVSIVVNGPGAATGTGKTDAQGKYVYTYTAVGTGPTVITGVAPGDVRAESVVQIDAAVQNVPDDVTIASATFTASPSVVGVNTVGSTLNRAELRLLFRSSSNAPVPNVRVRLGLGANASGTDGKISTNQIPNTNNYEDRVIVADANGLAISSFIPGTRSSPNDQIKIYACFGKSDAVEQIAACPIERLRTVSLTVVEEAVSVSIGTNNVVIDGTLTYRHDFTVLVVDSAGNPKPDAQLAATVDLPTYLKGNFYREGGVWKQLVTAICINEDNALGVGFRNNTIETGEDVNGNGQLDPRKSDVTISFVGSTKTDATGRANLRLEYPKNFGSWAEFAIRVSASGVVSPPAWIGRRAEPGSTIDNLTGIPQYLIIPGDVLKLETAPPFYDSPYGRTGSCTSPN